MFITCACIQNHLGSSKTGNRKRTPNPPTKRLVIFNTARPPKQLPGWRWLKGSLGQQTPSSDHWWTVPKSPKGPRFCIVAPEDAALANTEPQSHPLEQLDHFWIRRMYSGCFYQLVVLLPWLIWHCHNCQGPRCTYISSPVSPSCITSSSRQ